MDILEQTCPKQDNEGTSLDYAELSRAQGLCMPSCLAFSINEEPLSTGEQWREEMRLWFQT